MNFVSISLDDLVAFQSFKAHYAGILHTPNIERLSTLGSSFDNAFSQVAKCNPSRTSVLTGQRPEQTGVLDNNVNWYDLVDVTKTLPHVLADSGFATTVLGKVYHNSDIIPGAENFPFTLAADKSYWNGGFGSTFDSGVLEVPEELHGDYINTTDAIEVVEGWAPGEDNALFLGIYRPHSTHAVPQEYFDLYPLEDIEVPFTVEDDLDDVPAFMRDLVQEWYHSDITDAGYWAKKIQAYFASVSFADAQLGRLLDSLEAQGVMDETVIMMWSDHGYHLGEKDAWHKFTLWEEAARAPLVIYDPNASGANRVVDTPVELLDIMPTALDLLGLDTGLQLDGRSLSAFLNGDDPGQSGQAFTSMYGSLSLRTNDYRLTVYEDDSLELYDVVGDPRQIVNLASDPAYGDVVQDLLGRMQDYEEENGWVRAGTSIDLSDDATARSVIFTADDVEVVGPGGDTTYFLNGSGQTIVEAADGGIDTVYFRGDLALPDNVENAVGKEKTPANRSEVIGNSSDNFISYAKIARGRDGRDEIHLPAAGTAYGGGDSDSIYGSGRGDYIHGGADRDYLFGANGDDTLVGGFGDDILRGQGGFDTASYRYADGPVTVDLESGLGWFGTDEDRLFGIEAIEDSRQDDLLSGDNRANGFHVSTGDDSIDGRGGIDTVTLGAPFGNVASAWERPDGRVSVSLISKGERSSLLLTDIERMADLSGDVLDMEDFLARYGTRPEDESPFDFTGDGASDLLVQDRETGEMAVFDGITIGSTAIPAVGAFLATVDLDGDGVREIAYRSAPDTVTVTDMQGNRTATFGAMDEREILAFADFDGDGRDETLMRHTNSGGVFWIEASGTGIGFGAKPSGIAAIGDFNGSGTADILWRDASGQLRSNDGADGGFIARYEGGGDGTPVAVGDLDGDGEEEIVMSDPVTNEMSVLSRGSIPRVVAEAGGGTFQGLADTDGDGATDMVVRTSDGRFVALDHRGVEVSDFGLRPVHEAVAIADFDADGAADLLFRHMPTGGVFAVSGDGEAITGFGSKEEGAFLAAGDLNGNGTEDLLFLTPAGRVSANDGTGGFIGHYELDVTQLLLDYEESDLGLLGEPDYYDFWSIASPAG
ncbi:hypothetical protein OCH239_01240 [Roseivivax halodurans JCM 10272]|uniref:Sulfatase N-terminal domain-containing protein n=1 Tax=Roseivivax halodurans JCM 10272 TaxID=1449350 RepID=X7END9_9RHOB|nr:sulfatase-like hydrolase/transferase [Roseivivax halodurans]ETX16716.1 hypothetical protein OCH239_01240 [Roseivivax halodurans JCM 10272]